MTQMAWYLTADEVKLIFSPLLPFLLRQFESAAPRNEFCLLCPWGNCFPDKYCPEKLPHIKSVLIFIKVHLHSSPLRVFLHYVCRVTRESLSPIRVKRSNYWHSLSINDRESSLRNKFRISSTFLMGKCFDLGIGEILWYFVKVNSQKNRILLRVSVHYCWLIYDLLVEWNQHKSDIWLAE